MGNNIPFNSTSFIVDHQVIYGTCIPLLENFGNIYKNMKNTHKEYFRFVFGRNLVRISPTESAEIQNTANAGNGSVSVFKIIPDSTLFRLLKRYAVYFDRPIETFLKKKRLSIFGV